MARKEVTLKEVPRFAVISYKGLSRLIHSVTPRYSGMAHFQVVDHVFEDAAAAANELVANGEVDAIISAGANATYLRERVSVPVIRINVSGFDMLRALMRAGRLSDKIALVNYGGTDPNLEEVKHLINVDFEQRSYNTIEDARFQFKDLKRQGYRVIVGSSFVTELSEREGLTGILVYSEEAICEAIDIAIEVARTQRIEQGRRSWLNQIIQHLHEGVIAVDSEGRVQCCNPASERILGVDAAGIINQRLADLVPKLSQAATNGDHEATQQVLRVGAKLLVANHAPLREYGVHSGAVVTFQDSSTIEHAERNLRSQRRPSHYTAKYCLSGIIGKSPRLQRAIDLARQYAYSDSTVLLTGGSGTGKELFAQGIHNESHRASGRFVAINCAAFAESLLESELFGYEEGAFTGARKGGRAGLVETAHGGTLFLDEIGDMPINLQTRLLRVLQEREVVRLGGTFSTPVDVRVIAASNADLRQRVIDGGLREDLFYRLNILTIAVPDLKDRPEDILRIANQLLCGFLKQIGCDKEPEPLLDSLADRLEAYSWPGNVREVENLMERLAFFYAHSDDWNSAQSRRALYCVVPELISGGDRPDESSLKSEQRRAEINRIQQVVAECGGSIPEAAKRLGVSRTTLWRKLKRADGQSPSSLDTKA